VIRAAVMVMALAVLATACGFPLENAAQPAITTPSTTILSASSETTPTTGDVITSEALSPLKPLPPLPSTSVATTTTSTITTTTAEVRTTTTTLASPTTTVAASTTVAPATTTTVVSATTTLGTSEPSGVLAIGDSVMQAASNKYCGTLPAAIAGLEIYDVEGMVSRQFGSAKDIVAARVAAGRVPSVLIVHLGTNGPVSTSAFDALMAAAASVPKVVIVTINVPRSHEGPSNDVLRAGVSRYSNAALADWKAAATGHPEYFSNEELFHLNCNPGAAAYSGVIAAQV
jgi:hypothetical protein